MTVHHHPPSSPVRREPKADDLPPERVARRRSIRRPWIRADTPDTERRAA